MEVTFGMEVHRNDKHQPYSSLLWLLVAKVTKRYFNNSFVLSPIEFIFDVEVHKDDKHQPIPCYYGNSVVMAVRVKPGNKQHLRLLSA